MRSSNRKRKENSNGENIQSSIASSNRASANLDANETIYFGWWYLLLMSMTPPREEMESAWSLWLLEWLYYIFQNVNGHKYKFLTNKIGLVNPKCAV